MNKGNRCARQRFFFAYDLRSSHTRLRRRNTYRQTFTYISIGKLARQAFPH